jgi:hypothetical protein
MLPPLPLPFAASFSLWYVPIGRDSAFVDELHGCLVSSNSDNDNSETATPHRSLFSGP